MNKIHKIIHGSDRKLLLKFKGKSNIYMWVNLINGKYYIGSTKNLYEHLRCYYKTNDLKTHDQKSCFKNFS